MELWIRTQDKERLVQVKYIDLYTDEDIEENNEFRLYSYVDDNRQFLLGIYATKERALEVLDEIQRLIEDLQYLSYAIDNKEFAGYRPNVYEMPKE